MEYNEIKRLDLLLNDANIPHTLRKLFDGYQVCYPSIRNCVGDAIEHCGSYGHEEDLLEIMGLLTSEEEKTDEVLGYLTADEVFERIKKHWEDINDM